MIAILRKEQGDRVLDPPATDPKQKRHSWARPGLFYDRELLCDRNTALYFLLTILETLSFEVIDRWK